MKLHSVFYNYNYNHLSPTGNYKFGWGITTIDFDKDLKNQIVTHNGLKPEDVFNFNLTVLQPLIYQHDVDNDNLENVINQTIDAAVALNYISDSTNLRREIIAKVKEYKS